MIFAQPYYPPMGAFAFSVLGPLEVRHRGELVPVRGSRERAVLAVLLLEEGRLVPLGRLVEAVWDGEPPRAAEKAVRNAVSALRGRFAHAEASAALIETDPAGYRLRLEGNPLDVAEFRQRVTTARELASADRAADAAAELRAALGLWRGSALADLSGMVIEAAAARLDERRLGAWEDCLDLELGLGRHREVIAELQALADEWPLRERLAGQLMLALYRSGRQAEALDAYHRLAGKLVDELGIDPSAEVARLHEAILRQDRALDLDLATVHEQGQDSPPAAGRADEPAPRAAHVKPAQLPLDVPGFSGRAAELARLHALLPSGGPASGARTVMISAIGGMAGVGKTALAVRFARQVAERFPDGQLHVNLRGFGPSGPPTAPGDALRGFLTALGVPGESIPADADDQAALYRSLLADKQMLVLLDNACDAAQVRPLLPGSPGCLVIVTSRSQLTGLVVAEGARPLALGVLTREEARDLLARRLGPGQLDNEPAAADELASLCAGLPLALAIVAARAAARPGLALADLAAELRDALSRLDALDTGDPATDLRAVFSWSCRQLRPAAARMFRLLGLHPGPDVTAHAAASLAAIPVQDTPALLAELARSHLLTEHAPGRYAFHDLLRAYAADLATAPDAADDPRDALGRLIDCYLATAAVAMDLLHPAEAHRRPRIPPPQTPTAGLASAPAALAWLDAERPTLLAVTAHAAAHGWPGHAVRFSATLARYLIDGGHYAEGLAMHTDACRAARLTADHGGQARALRDIGTMYWRLGRCGEASEHFLQALRLCRHIGDGLGEARALDNLAVAEWHLGRTRLAVGHQEQALALFRQLGDGVGESITLLNLGDGLCRLGRYHEAADHLRQSLTLAREKGDRNSEAYALANLGDVEYHLASPHRAIRHYQQATAIFREMGHRAGEAIVLTGLGTVHNGLGQHERARQCHQQALSMFRDLEDGGAEAIARNGLGEAAAAADRPDEALTHHATALSLALDTGNREQQASAHAGLGHAYEALGDDATAREHFQKALDLYTSLDYPDAERIRARLARGGRRAAATSA